MDKEAKIMKYSELTEINDRGEVDTSYLGYDVYRRGSYCGTITRVTKDAIIVDCSGAYSHSGKNNKFDKQRKKVAIAN